MSTSGRAGSARGTACVAIQKRRPGGGALLKKRLADHGLQSERVLWQGKGPGVFEQELGDLEQRLMLTTVNKAVAWAQSSSDLARHLRARVLRDRDDVDRLRALRRRALRRRGVPIVAAPGRPADRLRPRRAQDGGAAAPDLRPDARAEVGDRDGRLRELGRDVQQLHRAPGRRQDHRRSTSTCPAARRGPRRSSRGSSACRRRSRRGFRPRTRSAGSQADLRGRPRPRRDARGARRDDARRRPAAARGGVHAPARPGRVLDCSSTSRRPTTSAGASAAPPATSAPPRAAT